MRLLPPSGRYLSFEEREDLALYRTQGLGMCAIGVGINDRACTRFRSLTRVRRMSRGVGASPNFVDRTDNNPPGTERE